jgi:hypothetical protein
MKKKSLVGYIPNSQGYSGFNFTSNKFHKLKIPDIYKQRQYAYEYTKFYKKVIKPKRVRITIEELP